MYVVSGFSRTVMCEVSGFLTAVALAKAVSRTVEGP